MNKLFFIIIVLACFLFGCNGVNHCIKVGGEYQGVTGDVEYCFSNKKTDTLGAPSYENDKGETLVTLPEETVLDLAAALRENGQVSALSVGKPCDILKKAAANHRNDQEEKARKEKAEKAKKEDNENDEKMNEIGTQVVR